MSTPPTVVGTRRQPEVALDRALEPQRLLHEARDETAVVAQQLLEDGAFAEQLERGREEAHGGLLAGREQVGGNAHHVDDLGQRAVGERRGRETRDHVVLRVPPAILDVAGEPGVEELQRTMAHRLARASDSAPGPPRPELGPECLVICFGDSEQIGDDEQRERARELADELALAVGDELVDLTIGEAPHEVLVLAQTLRRDEAHQQPAVRGVDRRVECRQLVAERQRVAVLVDERADVVAGERDREPREWPGHRVARREGRGVVEHRDRLLVTGDHHDVVVRFALHRALGAEVLEVGVGVGDERLVAEEVDPVEVSHCSRPSCSGFLECRWQYTRVTLPSVERAWPRRNTTRSTR